MPTRLERTGHKMAFHDVMIGQPFYAHGSYFIRVSADAGAELKGSDWTGAKVFNFEAEGTVESTNGGAQLSEEVEGVRVVTSHVHRG